MIESVQKNWFYHPNILPNWLGDNNFKLLTNGLIEVIYLLKNIEIYSGIFVLLMEKK